MIDWILYSGATCHMTPDISDFIPGLLVETDKITGVVQIKMRENNGKPIIATLNNVRLEPEFCNRLFSMIMLMNLGHT